MPRRKLDDKTSFDDIYWYAAYVEDALILANEDNDHEVGRLHTQVAPLLERWKTLDRDRLQAQRRIGRSHALVHRIDMQADTVVQASHDDTVVHLKLNKEDPLFKRLFPHPVNETIRLGLESEIPELRQLLTRFNETETPEVLRNAHVPRFTDIITKATDAISEREMAFSNQGVMSARISSLRDDINSWTLGVEGALLQIAAQRKLPRSWVDAFFPAPDRREKKKSSKDETIDDNNGNR